MARKAFAVNDAMRERVRYLAGVGVPQDDIAKIIGCAPKTLRKRCRNDLDRGIAEANATMCGYLFAAAKGGNVTAQIFWLKTRAHWRERPPEAPVSNDNAANAPVVLVLPDNSRDPELTEVLRDAQEKYFARKPRRQPPRFGSEVEARPGQTENAAATLPDGGPNPPPGDEEQTASAGRRLTMPLPFTATISAQPGPQTAFLRSAADICIYGGAAGGGKTVGLILEPLRHVGRVANFTAVFFRRTTPQITNPGALWDESLNFYPRLAGTPHLGAREWRWPCGGKIKFSHLQFENTVYDWQGAQIALICFDELTHFTAHQFFYMVSRNRSTCGVRPYIRATCNPDADSWVADFLAWWIDPETGLPILERAGVLRYYLRVADRIEWADRPEDLLQHLPRPEDLPPGIEPPRPLSVTFIPATVFDNPALLRVNPEYFGWLSSMPLLERERLLNGNWKIRPSAGLYFKREWCSVADEVPADLDVVRYWDLAATEKTEFNDPDWTVGIKLGRDKHRGYWLLDMVRRRANPGDVEKLLLDTAEQDGKRVRIGFGRDPGQAGKSQALHVVRALGNFTVQPAPESGDKLTRFGPFSSQCRAGNVKIRRGPWNEELFRVLEGFPDLAHDDEVDACSGALEMLNPGMKSWGYYEWSRQAAEALEEQQSKPEPVIKPTFARGSMEWQAEQEKASRTTTPAPERVSLAGDPTTGPDN